MEIISKYFEEQANKIISQKENISITLSLEFFNEKIDQKDFLIKPFMIDSITIKQLFYYNVSDDIVVNLKFLPKDVYLMFNNIESLRCRMIIKFIDHDTGEINNERDYIIREYITHVPNFDDLYKKFIRSQITSDDKNTEPYLEQQHGTVIPLTIQLLDPIKYVFRKKLLNTMFQKTDIKSILLYICKRFNLTNVKYDQGINENIYQNIYIPQEYGKFKNIFDYIHKRYGIYDKGFSYYFFNNIFYLYKPFENVINANEPIINIFKVPYLHYGNLRKYHTYIDNNLWIICDNNIEYKNISLINLENDGTNHIFLKSDNLIDNQREVNENNVIVNKNTINLRMTDQLNRISKKTITINYKKPSMNYFYQSSLLAEKSTAILNLIWKFPIPFSIYPGQYINFFYQKDDKIIQQSGRIENVGYTLNRQKQIIVNYPIFGTQANIQIRLSLLN